MSWQDGTPPKAEADAWPPPATALKEPSLLDDTVGKLEELPNWVPYTVFVPSLAKEFPTPSTDPENALLLPLWPKALAEPPGVEDAYVVTPPGVVKADAKDEPARCRVPDAKAMQPKKISAAARQSEPPLLFAFRIMLVTGLVAASSIKNKNPWGVRPLLRAADPIRYDPIPSSSSVLVLFRRRISKHQRRTTPEAALLALCSECVRVCVLQ